MSVSWFGTGPARSDTVKYVLLPITIVLLLVTVYFFNFRPIVEGNRFVVATASCLGDDPDISLFRSILSANMRWADQEINEQLFTCAVRELGEPLIPADQKKSLIDLAVGTAEALAVADRNDARSNFLAGAFLDHIGMISGAQGTLERAHELSPMKQQISFELAANYLYQKKDDNALAVLKSAYESAPQYAVAASAYAVALMIDGKEKDARSIPGVDSALLDTVKSYTSPGSNFLKPVVIYQGVIVDSSDYTLLQQQASKEYAMGMNDQAVQTLQTIENIYPGYKDLMESAIKQIRERPAP